MNALADEADDFCTVLIGQADGDRAELFIQQLAHRHIRHHVFPDLLNRYPQVLRHVGVVRREFSDQLGVLFLEPCSELIYLGLLFLPGADDACKDARLADVRDERLNLCS